MNVLKLVMLTMDLLFSVMDLVNIVKNVSNNVNNVKVNLGTVLLVEPDSFSLMDIVNMIVLMDIMPIYQPIHVMNVMIDVLTVSDLVLINVSNVILVLTNS